MAKRIFLLRHAQSIGNIQGAGCGKGDLDKLSEQGRTDALGARKKFSGMLKGAAKKFVSSLGRARETARLILPDENFIIDARLDEMNLGNYYFSPENKFSAKEHAGFSCNYKFPGGESREELFVRANNWLDEITALMCDGDEVLAVTHAGPIECILQKVCGVPMNYLPVFFPANLSLTTLLWYDGNELFGDRHGWMLENFSYPVG